MSRPADDDGSARVDLERPRPPFARGHAQASCARAVAAARSLKIPGAARQGLARKAELASARKGDQRGAAPLRPEPLILTDAQFRRPRDVGDGLAKRPHIRGGRVLPSRMICRQQRHDQLGEVWILRQDEAIDPERHVFANAQGCRLRIANQRGAGAAATIPAPISRPSLPLCSVCGPQRRQDSRTLERSVSRKNWVIASPRARAFASRTSCPRLVRASAAPRR
jgi:hypothetical protein